MSTIDDFLIAITRKPILCGPILEKTTSNDASSSSKINEKPEVPVGDKSKATLKRSLNLRDLIFYGVGCSVGAGIYSLVVCRTYWDTQTWITIYVNNLFFFLAKGIGAELAGPSISLSFLLCGVACVFTSLSYAEFAARVPLAGSAYTFTYVAFGELCAWIVGWNLTLGYAISAAAVARSWALYVADFLSSLLHNSGFENDLDWLTRAPIPWISEEYSCSPLSMLIIFLCTLVLVTGVKESSKFNTIMTILNIFVLCLVVFTGSAHIRMSNLVPFMPQGVSGVARGAGLVFFSYLGFDMVSCLSEEVINPATTMPAGIIGSLLMSVLIYVSVSLVVVGMVPLEFLGPDVPLSNAFLTNACCSPATQIQLVQDAMDVHTCLDYTCSPIRNHILYYGSRLISFAAMFGLTTATFTCLMGQPRIFYRMAQDGLFFKIYARINHKTGVPTAGTILTGIFTGLAACFIDLESLANAISLGTLQVFTLVNSGVILLRIRSSTSNDSRGIELPSSQREMRSSDSLDSQSSLTNYILPGQYNSVLTFLRKITRTDTKRRATLTIVSLVLSSITGAVLLSNARLHFILEFLIFVAFGSASLLFIFPKAPPPKTFQCPCVPLVPILGIVINCYMMGSFILKTWLMVLLWIIIGLVVYFSYGIHNSELRQMSQIMSTTNEEEDSFASNESGSTTEVSSPLLADTTPQAYKSI